MKLKHYIFLAICFFSILIYGCENKIDQDSCEHELISFEDIEPTCSRDGYKNRVKCNKCGYENKEILAALGHDYIEYEPKKATCAEDGYYGYVSCKVCGYNNFESIPKLEHTFTDYWTVDKKYTRSTQGLMSRHCLKCSATTDKHIIPANYDSTISTDFVFEDIKTGWAIIANRNQEKEYDILELPYVYDNRPVVELREVDDSIGNVYNCKTLVIPFSISKIDQKILEKHELCFPALEKLIVEEENLVFDSRDNCNGIIETSTNSLIMAFDITKIPESIDTIDSFAYSYTSKVKEINIPSNITRIASGAFSNSEIEKIIFEENSQLENIEASIFSGCYNLTEFIMPDSITSIGENAFLNCVSLKNVYFSKNLQKLEERTFCYSSLETLDLSNCLLLEEIPLQAFLNCPINEIIFPNTLITIGEGAFTGTLVENINLPSGLTTIDSTAFSGCNNLRSINVDENNSVYDSRDNSNAIIETSTNTLILGCNNTTIPNTVTSIGAHAFERCCGLTTIEIPNSVTSIGYSAFSDCISLMNIELPNSITSIGSYVFKGCNNLTSIEIPNSVTSIGYSAFFDCISLMNIEIPNSVTTIGSYAFSGCSSLTDIEIPNSVTSIENYAFARCGSLTSIEIPNNVKVIGFSAFSECMNLESITLPFIGYALNGKNNTHFGYIFGASSNLNNSLYVPTLLKEVIITGGTSIGDYAFEGCNSLISIVIPDSFRSIGVAAFYGCNSLTSLIVDENNPVYDSRDNCNGIIETSTNTLIQGFENTTIPNSVTAIGDYAFSYYSSLSKIEIPNSVTSIGNHAFSGCISLTSIGIPNSVTSIGNHAFSGCSSLTSIEIPNSVTSIGDYAFSGCSSLASIEIPNSVTTIGSYGFSGCSSLTSIEIPNSITILDDYTFYDCSSLTSIIISNSVKSIEKYVFSSCDSLIDVYYNGTINEWNNISWYYFSNLNFKSINIYVLNQSGEYVKIKR